MPRLPIPKNRLSAKNRPVKFEVEIGGQKLGGTSEDIYQARRRYVRAGERYEKQAAKETGAAADRLRALAEANYKTALSMYENEQAAAKFAEKHNLPTPKKPLSEGARSRLVEESSSALESVRKDPRRRRELEARELMRGPVGSRIMAATKDIWYDPTAEKQDMALAYRRIEQAFGADSMAGVIKKFEDELGDELYQQPKDFETISDSPSTIRAARLARKVMRNAK